MLPLGIRRIWIIALDFCFLAVLISVARADEFEELVKLQKQVHALRAAGKHQQAIPLAEQLVLRAEQGFPDRPALIATSLNDLAGLHLDQRQYAQAESLYKRALALREQALGGEHLHVAASLYNLGVLYADQGRYTEAEPLYKRALVIREKALGDHQEVADNLNNLGNLYVDQARFADAKPLYLKALAIYQKIFGSESVYFANTLNNLAGLSRDQGRYTEAEPLYVRSLEIRKKVLGEEHPLVAASLNNLANLRCEQGRYAEAESLHKQSLAMKEKLSGPKHPDVAAGLNNLASLYDDQGRYAEAEPLYLRSLAICESVFGREHLFSAGSLNNLAVLYKNQGRYAEAEPLQRRALAIREMALGSEHPDVAESVNNLAALYKEQQRYAEAEPLYKRALVIRERTLGGEHSGVAGSLSNLADLYNVQGRYTDAEPLHTRALDIKERAVGKEHPDVAAILNNLANVHINQSRYDLAEPLHQRALTIREKAFGADHPHVATSLINLAVLNHDQGRYAEAQTFIERANRIGSQAGTAPGLQHFGYLLSARIAWKLDRREQAISDLLQAMQLAEQQRGQIAGGEQQRAVAFAQFGAAYEQMVQWQLELGDVAAALSAIERSRARSLMDQMSAAHIDLLAGVPPDQAQRLRAAEAASLSQIASIEKQMELIRLQANLSDHERAKQVAALQADLVAARQTYTDAFAAIRNASPAYRRMVGHDFKPSSLTEIQDRLAGNDRLVLEYLLGLDGGYVLVIPPHSRQARIEKLALSADQAAKLGVESGPLTDARMRAILSNDAGTGLLQHLRSPDKAAATSDRLAVLWQVLVPEPERKLLVEGTLKHCIVIPDAALASFPLETLVVEPGDNPKFLLDVGPPIITAPSATLLMNLAASKAENESVHTRKPGEKVLLSVADPNYGAPSTGPLSPLAELSARSRYGTLHGSLSPLPFTAWECAWVAETFRKAGFDAGVLQKASAREASVRTYAPGRKFLHFACHGLVDQSHGNLFGALALTPGPKGAADPTDDGFLTLAEIYELNLSGAELSILSACDTNYGPNQQGEGSWSLSRGFLVAGSRRVVASNWLVDDEAGASLVSVFCAAITKGKFSEQPDYAASLQTAKRWVRNQEKWRSPYYWATFVLLGPN